MDNPSFKQRAYANAGFVIGDDGVVVIDTLTGCRRVGPLWFRKFARSPTLPVRFVVNTHYHGDHVAGNKALCGRRRTMLAHRNVRTWIHAENLRLLGDKPKPDLITFIEQLAAPTMSTRAQLTCTSARARFRSECFRGTPAATPLSSSRMPKLSSAATSSGRMSCRTRSMARRRRGCRR